MAAMNRRDLCLSAGAFAALGLLAEAQSQRAPADTIDMTKSRVFHFDQMTVQQHANGGWGRPVMHGTLPTGEFVEVHETMLPPGQMPHPPHKHRNTEFVLMREGNDATELDRLVQREVRCFFETHRIGRQQNRRKLLHGEQG